METLFFAFYSNVIFNSWNISELYQALLILGQNVSASLTRAKLREEKNISQLLEEDNQFPISRKGYQELLLSKLIKQLVSFCTVFFLPKESSTWKTRREREKE